MKQQKFSHFLKEGVSLKKEQEKQNDNHSFAYLEILTVSLHRAEDKHVIRIDPPKCNLHVTFIAPSRLICVLQ